MRVLVTGGAGFLGSHLCDRLMECGHRVVCLDDLSTGSKENVRGLLRHKNFRFLQHDILKPVRLKVDRIFHLACPASPVHYQADPVRTMKTNVMGTINVLELARRNRARILQASTSEVYGDPEVHPQPESYLGNVNPVGPRACYDEGKRAAEALTMDYARAYGVEVRIARIFNTYGPRMSVQDGRVISNFIGQALHHRPLTVHGDGRQTRSFCYVDDLMDGLMRLMDSKDLAGPINFGNPEEMSVLELAKRIITLTGSQSSIVFESSRTDDPRQRRPDISRARETLGWEPKVSINEGLKRTIEFFEGLLKERRAGKRLASTATRKR